MKIKEGEIRFIDGNIMGSCWPNEYNDHSQEERMSDIHIDSTNPLLHNYHQIDSNTFQKRIYDWMSIPIINQFPCRGPVYFEVRNRGIKDSNFVVGVIKRSAISTQLAMPWRTHYCICYESHKNPGESGLIFDGKVTKTGQAVGEGEVVRVVMGQQEVQFKSNKKTLGYMKLPVDFLSDEILPYVALFHEGDKVEFLQPVIVK